MAGYINYDDPYDFGGALQRGLEGGRVRRAKTEAKGYLDQGDYDAAAKTLLPYDPEQAQNYLTYGKRKADQDYSSGVTPYLAKNDFEGAKQYAVSKSRPVDDLMKLQDFAAKASDRERQEKAEIINRAAEGLYAAAQFAETGDMDGYNGAIEALAGQGFDVKDFQGQPYNPARLNAELVKSQKGLEILTARRAERKLDLDERRVGATELTAQAAMARADNAGGSKGPRWRIVKDPAEMERIGVQTPVLYDDETGNMKAAPGAVSPVLADSTQRGRVVMTLPNAVSANATIEKMEGGGYSIGKKDWGAAMAGAIPWDGGTAQQFVGGDDYQMYTNAAKTFESAIMPILSGAAVTPSEAQRVMQSALPQPGDGPERLKAKALARQGLVNGAAAMIGKEPPYPNAPTLDILAMAQQPAAGSAPAGAGQRLTPEQASALPPGTPFIGMDGKQRVRK